MKAMEEIRREAHGSAGARQYRPRCLRCRRPNAGCYCALVKPFESAACFVILTQPREAKHRLGTGRMARLCLRNSLLLEGADFSQDDRVNREIENPEKFSLLLYPGRDSINLSRMTGDERAALIPCGRRLVVFVLDGTWKSVRKMIRLSPNLARLPAICFDPPAPSAYRIRRQPRPQCYSTVEAIHQAIDLLESGSLDRCQSHRPHDNLLEVFHSMVARQLTYPS